MAFFIGFIIVMRLLIELFIWLITPSKAEIKRMEDFKKEEYTKKQELQEQREEERNLALIKINLAKAKSAAIVQINQKIEQRILWDKYTNLWDGTKYINEMSGLEFEKYVALLYQQMGFEIELTPTNGDYGADIIAFDKNRKKSPFKRNVMQKMLV